MPRGVPDTVYRWFVRDCFRVVYEHDADGQALSGSIDVLREVLMRKHPAFALFVGVSTQTHVPSPLRRRFGVG